MNFYSYSYNESHTHTHTHTYTAFIHLLLSHYYYIIVSFDRISRFYSVHPTNIFPHDDKMISSDIINLSCKIIWKEIKLQLFSHHRFYYFFFLLLLYYCSIIYNGIVMHIASHANSIDIIIYFRVWIDGWNNRKFY